MISIAKPYFNKREIDAVTQVLRSGMIAQGEVTKKLENEFKTLCGARYAIATNNGTSALHTALYAVDLRPGDEVITTPFTFIATINSILMIGAKPVFVDIDPRTYNLDPTKIEQVISKKTKAILVVNLYGQPADYNAINAVAKKHNLIVIEDAAQSINASFKKKQSGNLGDIACFSLYATKNVTCGEGGMITTNNSKYYERALLFRNHGQPPNKRYTYADLGYNYRMTDIQSAIALEQLKKINTITKKRQNLARRYDDELNNIQGLVIPFKQNSTSHVFHQYTLRITPKFKINRDTLQSILFKKGIQTVVYYPATLNHFPHIKIVCKIPAMLEVAETASREVLSVPIHPSLTIQELTYITRMIKEI